MKYAPLSSVIDALLWPVYLRLAMRRRQSGHYDQWNSRLFERAFNHKSSSENCFRYLKYQRDLGYKPSGPLLESLVSMLNELTPAARRFAINSLVEASSQCALDEISSDILMPFSEQSPVAALSLVRRKHGISEAARTLSKIQSEQSHWRAEFVRYVEQNRGSICIVGNASTLEGKRLGKAIDAHQVVFRFNHFSGHRANSSPQNSDQRSEEIRDLGHRLQAWTLAPDITPPYPNVSENPQWIILSGPEAHYHVANWSNIQGVMSEKRRLLSVPLPVWQNLVCELRAPPSAGLLCMAWIIHILGTPEGLSAVGFQIKQTSRKRYHYALRDHKPNSRHNWKGELEIKARWRNQGLQFLE